MKEEKTNNVKAYDERLKKMKIKIKEQLNDIIRIINEEGGLALYPPNYCAMLLTAVINSVLNDDKKMQSISESIVKLRSKCDPVPGGLHE